MILRMMLYDFVILLFCINYSMLCAVCPREHLCCSFDIHDLFMFACVFLWHVRFFGGDMGLQQISSDINFIASGFQFCSLFGQGAHHSS